MPSPVARALHRPSDLHASKVSIKSAIVDAALRIAAQVGLEGLSIGALAEAMQMSKSGVFAHFGSRDELQIPSREYYTRF